jgi:hypothetical protein
MMAKRTFAGGLLGLFGLSKTAVAQDEVTMIDPRTILFSIPTISNDAPPLDRFTGEPSESDVVFHEDEWRQLEFFAPSRLSEVQQALRELKAFANENRVQSGWRRIYTRNIAPAPVLAGGDALNSIAASVGARVEPAPLIFHGAGSIDGRIRNGFSLRLGPGAVLYGFRDQTGIAVLGANLQNAEDRLLTDAFSTLNRSHDLLLVDWQAQMLVTSVEANGQIGVWSP